MSGNRSCFPSLASPRAIAIGVLKGDRSDLVDYRAFPPLRLFSQSHASILRSGMKTARRWNRSTRALAGRTARLLTAKPARRVLFGAAEAPCATVLVWVTVRLASDYCRLCWPLF